MEEERNLKGTRDTLRYFRLSDTGKFEERARLIDVFNEPTSRQKKTSEDLIKNSIDMLLPNHHLTLRKQFSIFQDGQLVKALEGFKYSFIF